MRGAGGRYLRKKIVAYAGGRLAVPRGRLASHPTAGNRGALGIEHGSSDGMEEGR